MAAARTLPWLAMQVLDPPARSAWDGVGYIPKDFLQYLAFMRQTAETGAWLLIDPFTLEPQSGRFLAPGLSALGALAGALGAPPAAVLELARTPLLFAFFAVLWWFVAPFVRADDGGRERALACVLVGLSGGLEVLVRPFGELLPEEPARMLAQGTWQMNGWTTFAAAYNPLWIAGGIGVMVWLRPVLGDRARGPLALTALAAGGFALYLVHPYSAVGALAIGAGAPLLAAAAGAPLGRARALRLAGVLCGAGAAIAALAQWQRQDPVFAAAAAEALGGQQLSPFWYPLVYGALGVLVLRGARRWARGAHPLRFALLGWVGTVVLLHTSPLFNGYHFASLLHLPLCILATPALVAAVDRIRTTGTAVRGSAIALLALVFAAPILQSAESLATLPRTHTIPEEYPQIARALSALPAGGVLCSPRLGNWIPAHTAQRVYVGHHFLTPDYEERARAVREWTRSPRGAPALRRLVREQPIDYAVLPTRAAAPAVAALAPLAHAQRAIGRFTLLELAPREP